MKKRVLFMAAMVAVMAVSIAASVGLSGCSKGDSIKGDDSRAIHFGANVTATRAVINSGETGLPSAEIAGIQVLRGADGGTPGWASLTAVTTTGTLATTGAMTVAAVQNMNADGSNANFTAYYPASDAAPSADKVTFTIDGKKDVLSAPAKAITAADPNCAFAFAHKLSQVELVVKAADESVITLFGNLTDATIESDSKVELTVSTQALATATGSAKTDFKFYNGDTAFSSAALTTTGITVGQCVVPAMSLTKLKMTFANRASKEYSLATALTLATGSKHVVTATVSATGVTFTATVSAWGSGGAGTIPMQ